MPTPATPHVPELPAPLTRFVGRARELGDLQRLLGGARLVTLTGIGGSGKSRLAREAAMAIAGRFERVAWVDLAPLADAGLLPNAVGDALDGADGTRPHSSEFVAAAVGTARVLLVLDNCEHLVDACGALAAQLLRRCPGLTILGTSREALGVPGETAWLVPPLEDDERVQLFLDRAQAALPAFALTPANAGAVTEICRRLDGLPLALELAAARVRVLSPEQIAARLDDAFRLLAAGSRHAVPRHRTLRAAMEWSHELLTPHEQLLFRRLSVFAGSFTLDAVEAVCAGDPLDVGDLLDGIAALVDKSLVALEPGEGPARYRLLDTVRQYACERLRASGEEEAWQRRHALHYLGLLAAPPTLRVQALGPLTVFVGDRLVDPGAWGSARPRELLVYFLAHPAGRTREQVGLAFWPDASPSQLRNNFHVTLHRLRRALGARAWVVLSGDRYRIDPRLVADFDVPTFERELDGARRALQRDEPGATARLEEALALYRGAFLEGEVAGDWHIGIRDRVHRLHLDGLHALGDRLIRDGACERGAEVLHRVLAHDELHEQALLALMRCYTRMGERARAIRLYHRFAERLRAELAVRPGAEVARLYEQLQAGGGR